MQMAMLGGVIFFAVVSVMELRRASTWRNILLTLIFVPLSVLVLWREAAHTFYLLSLRDLRSEQVSQIVISGSVLEQGQKMEAVISALNKSVWFEPKHGGWRRPSDISITLKSGRSMRISVALYRSGAVILGRGEAFSATLPSVLLAAGHPLSEQLNR